MGLLHGPGKENQDPAPVKAPGMAMDAATASAWETVREDRSSDRDFWDFRLGSQAEWWAARAEEAAVPEAAPEVPATECGPWDAGEAAAAAAKGAQASVSVAALVEESVAEATEASVAALEAAPQAQEPEVAADAPVVSVKIQVVVAAGEALD